MVFCNFECVLFYKFLPQPEGSTKQCLNLIIGKYYERNKIAQPIVDGCVTLITLVNHERGKEFNPILR